MAVFFLVTMISVLLDQNRLQPWVYQFLLLSILFTGSNRTNQVKWMRWFTISIYIYSAISKFDYQFVFTVGQSMWDGIFKTPPAENWEWVTLIFPAYELTAAILLLWSPTRKFGLILALLMHTGLLIALGPFGLNQSLGVLIWNLFFMVQTIYLFGICSDLKNMDVRLSFRDWIGQSAIVVAILFPMTQPLGIADHWPSWEVYAPRTSRSKFFADFRTESAENPFAEESLKKLGVPLYPQARYQFAIQAALAKREKAFSGTLLIQSESDRWNGERESSRIREDQIEMFRDRFWLNTKPRHTWLK